MYRSEILYLELQRMKIYGKASRLIRQRFEE